jgi:hypothetical protein
MVCLIIEVCSDLAEPALLRFEFETELFKLLERGAQFALLALMRERARKDISTLSNTHYYFRGYIPMYNLLVHVC